MVDRRNFFGIVATPLLRRVGAPPVPVAKMTDYSFTCEIRADNSEFYAAAAEMGRSVRLAQDRMMADILMATGPPQVTPFA